MRIEIELSRLRENDELGEILHHQDKLQNVSAQIAKLAESRDEAVISLNRIIRCAISEAKLKRDDIRDIEFPPFIVQGKSAYTITDGKLTIIIPDTNVVPLTNGKTEKESQL